MGRGSKTLEYFIGHYCDGLGRCTGHLGNISHSISWFWSSCCHHCPFCLIACFVDVNRIFAYCWSTEIGKVGLLTNAITLLTYAKFDPASLERKPSWIKAFWGDPWGRMGRSEKNSQLLFAYQTYPHTNVSVSELPIVRLEWVKIFQSLCLSLK